MALLETLLGYIVKEGGTAALKKISSEIDKKTAAVRRVDKRQWAEEMGSVITRSIITGDSTLSEPLRPLIAEFRRLMGEGLVIKDGATVLDFIEQSEAQDLALRAAQRGRVDRSKFSRSSAFNIEMRDGRVAPYKRPKAKKAAAKKSIGIQAAAKKVAQKKPGVRKPSGQ